MSQSTTGKHFGRSIATWVIITLAMAIKPVYGQIYPVQANINVTPPYTVYISHYTSADQQRIMASILLHDPVVTSLDVRFRFTIEGGGVRLYTNPGWIPQPFSLTNGITELIPSDVIAEYFQPQHLIVEGTNPQDFFRNGKLPEGFYQFKVEVLEYQRGVTISNTARTGIWLLLNEAPRMVFPTANQKVKATNPQMLNFSWVPGGISSPLSAQTTMYEFTMVELMDNMDPTIAITTASDAIKFTKTLQQTSLFYGPGEPQLIPGKRYAIRVRAYNTEGYELFKNNGYSEVRVFQFGDACNPPISFNLQDETQSTFDISVQTDPSNTAWQAQFRESSDDSGTWSDLRAEDGVNNKTVKGLKSSTQYDVQVKAICGAFNSDYISSKSITTKVRINSQHSCENTTSPFVVTQAQPLLQLKKNDIFLAALMPIQVTEVTKQGGGKFTGSGVATVPLFNTGLAVTFEDIGINELMQLTSGEVKAVRNELNLTLFGDVTTPTGGGTGSGGSSSDTTGNGLGDWPPFTDTITIDVPFDSVIVVNDSTVWVIPTGGGDPIVVDLGGNDCTLLVPADGNMDNAKVVYNGAAKPYGAGSGNGTDSEQEQFTGFLAKFTAAQGQQYGFDSLRHQAHANYYQEMEVNGKLIKLPWKALAVGQIDPVNLKVRRSSEATPYSDLKISVMGGAELQPTTGANTANQTYNLTGTTEGDEFAVVTKFRSGDKDLYAGGIWAATYQQKNFNLYIVPLPGVNVPEATIGQVQNGLNQIYSQAVVHWNVQPMNGLTGVELGDNGLDWADSEMLSAYNTEMNSVISAFKDWKTNADPDAYYLFVVPQFSEGGVEGFMPRNRRFGFVTLSQLDARLVAHEIGHGAFNLRHTFPEAQQGSTDNLMDYTQDKFALLKAQWDLIHNPETTTGLFDDMEDGASMLPDLEFVRQFVEGMRCAYASGSEFEIKEHGIFIRNNNFASDVLLSDGNTYGNIDITVFAEGSYKIGNLSFSEVNNRVIVSFGRVFSVSVSGKNKDLFKNFIKANSSTNDFERANKLKEIVLKAQSIQEVKVGLEQYNSMCILKMLDKDTRIKILDWLFKSDDEFWTIYDKNIVYELLKHAPPSQTVDLLKGFMANNYKWLYTLWEQGSESYREKVIDYIVLLLKPNYGNLGIKPTSKKIYMFDSWNFSDIPVAQSPFCIGLQENSFIWTDNNHKIERGSYDDAPSIEFLSTGKILFTQEYTLIDKTQIIKSKNSRDIQREFAEKIDYSLQPFEPVIVYFGRNYATLGIEGEKQYYVPAIWALRMEDATSDEEFNENLRAAGNITAIALAPFSGGGSSFIVFMGRLGAAVAAADIAIQNEKATLKQQELEAQQDFYQAWDKLYTAVVVTDGSIALLNVSRTITIPRSFTELNGLVTTKWGNLSNGVKQAWTDVKALKLAKGADWSTAIGKNIDELAEAPKGYQFYTRNEQKFIRRINASDPNTPQLTVRYGKIVQVTGKIVTNADEIKLLLKTDANKAFFWSGRTDGIGGKNKALEIAKSKGGTTLEGLIDDYKINMPEWNEADATAVKIWEDVSAAYANQVSGEVRAVVGNNLRSGNVWENIELRRLKANKSVTKITVIDPKTLEETIIWTR
ncbi:hypothetical protein CYCD_11230 [Tenuifilaceae bacterium CYCD]|nr:hypothetical protein CYCD_11230 [Tenuifilaceae bacterium CYCD]